MFVEYFSPFFTSGAMYIIVPAKPTPPDVEQDVEMPTSPILIMISPSSSHTRMLAGCENGKRPELHTTSSTWETEKFEETKQGLFKLDKDRENERGEVGERERARERKTQAERQKEIYRGID